MPKTFEELIKEIKEDLKSSLTADNADKVTKLDKNIDEIVESHAATEKKLKETQELFINQMKETGFKTPQPQSKDKQEPQTEEEIFEAAIEEAKKYEKDHKEE